MIASIPTAYLSHLLLYSGSTFRHIPTVGVLALFFATGAGDHIAYEFGMGFMTMILGIAITPWIPEGNLVRKLGRWSFGIYLMHFAVVQAVQIAGVKLGLLKPQAMSIAEILGVTAFSSILCLSVMDQMDKHAPAWSRPFVGLK